MSLDLTQNGVLPSQMIAECIKRGWIGGDEDIPDENIQPASLDLRLGDIAYRLRCSFLPDDATVEDALHDYQRGKSDVIDLRGGAVLEQDRLYLVPLVEQLRLPDEIWAKANPKSSTGRLDIFTRLIADRGTKFDEVPSGYQGRLYLEIAPRTFTIRVKPGIALNQLRFVIGDPKVPDSEIYDLHGRCPVLFHKNRALAPSELVISDGLSMGLDLGGDGGNEPVGYRARAESDLIDLTKEGHYRVASFWDEVISEKTKHGPIVVLRRDVFYLLLSQESVKIPPDYAAEMVAYDPTSGELRTHYAGFFDPGFGYDPEAPAAPGSRVALEVRAFDAPFALKHGRKMFRLSFEKMIEPPDRLYGGNIGSNYQRQAVALGKHFQRTQHRKPTRKFVEQNSLFPDLSLGLNNDLQPPRWIPSVTRDMAYSLEEHHHLSPG